MTYLHLPCSQPELKHLKSGGLYLVHSEHAKTLFDFSCHWVDADTSSLFMVSPNMAGFFESAISTDLSLWQLHQSGRVKSFSLEKHGKHQASEQFINSVFAELDFYPQSQGCKLIFDLPINFFAGLTKSKLIDAFNRLAELCLNKNITCLLTLGGDVSQQPELQGALAQSMFSGLAHLKYHAGLVTAHYEFWHGQGQLSHVKEVFNAQPKTHTVWQSHASLVHDRDTPDDGSDDVLIIPNTLLNEQRFAEQLPKDVILCRDNDEVYLKASKYQAATLLMTLDSTAPQNVLKTARSCYELRKQMGVKAKLIVAHTAGFLRYQDERLLQAVGINAVIPKGENVSHILTHIEGVQGVQMHRQLPPSFDHVMQLHQEALPSGYKKADEFVKYVLTHSEAAKALDVSGVLLVFELSPEQSMRHTLGLFKLSRNGDVFTNSDSAIYVYLHACREQDVPNALKRLFQLDARHYFLASSVFTDLFFVRQQCDALMSEPHLIAKWDQTDVLASMSTQLPASDDKAGALQSPFNEVERRWAKKTNLLLSDEAQS